MVELCEIRCKFYTHLSFSLSLSLMKKAIIDHIDCGKKKFSTWKISIALAAKSKKKMRLLLFSCISFLPVDSINTDEMNQCMLLQHLSQCALKKIDNINADFPREKTIYFLINLHVIGL